MGHRCAGLNASVFLRLEDQNSTRPSISNTLQNTKVLIKVGLNSLLLSLLFLTFLTSVSRPYEMQIFNLAITVSSRCMSISSYIFISTYM